MEYQKIIIFLTIPHKFKTKNWVKINDEPHGVYNTGSQIKFETSTLRSSLYDYIDTYILVQGTMTVSNTSIP